MVKTKDKKKNVATGHPVRLAYQPPCSRLTHQPPASSTFLSEQTSTNHQPNENLSEQTSTNHQPNENGSLFLRLLDL
jgi:hypothetical protein